VSALWWHVYGGEIPAEFELGVDEDGNPSAVHAFTIAGEATVPPDELVEKCPDVESVGGVRLPYLASFDHEPTDAELDELKPEQYRDVS